VGVLALRTPIAALIAALMLAALTGGSFVLLGWVAYQAGQRCTSRSSTAVAAGAVAGSAAVRLLPAHDVPQFPQTLISTYAVFVVLPLLVGRYLAQQRQLVATLDRHNRQLRRERELLAEQERLRERLRIARDMHDSLGHRLGLLSIEATIKTYVSRILAKLGCANRVQAALLARDARDAAL
jgi:signal transduction histidine kinase